VIQVVGYYVTVTATSHSAVRPGGLAQQAERASNSASLLGTWLSRHVRAGAFRAPQSSYEGARQS
ncbi:MAG: hypothetical protein ACRDZP_01915, partial [Acidimicrobiales bacterium]